MTVSDRIQGRASGMATLDAQQPMPWLKLLALVLFALAIRWALFIGYQGYDDRSYIAFGDLAANGGNVAKLGIADPWVGRIWAWLPMSLAMRVFGHNEFSMVFHSLLASLGSVIVAFSAGRYFFGARAGVIAALMMAVLPIDVLYGTRAFGDESTGFLCACTLLAFLTALEKDSRRWAFVTGLCWGLGYLSKEIAVLMALPFGLILLQRRRFPLHLLVPMALGLALPVLFELAFWTITAGDPLYRWHSTLGSRASIVPPARPILSWIDWIPSPIPSEVLRSSNTLIDAFLMLTTNEEWGFLFYLAVPLALVGLVRGDKATRGLSVFMLTMLLLLLFLPLHFPNYTLGRDPRHFTMTGLPAVLLIAAWLARCSARIAALVLAGLAFSWAVCIAVGYMGSDLSTQRALTHYVVHEADARVWSSNVVISDVVALSGFSRDTKLGVIRVGAGRPIGGDGYELSNPMRAMRADVPVASRVEELSGQLLALPEGVAPQAGWTQERVFAPKPSALASAMESILQTLGVPQKLIDKALPSHGEKIYLYRVVA